MEPIFNDDGSVQITKTAKDFVAPLKEALKKKQDWLDELIRQKTEACQTLDAQIDPLAIEVADLAATLDGYAKQSQAVADALANDAELPNS